MPTLHLTEWTQSEPVALDARVRSVLEDRFAAKIVTKGLDLYAVTAGGRVGTVTVDDLTITISPRFGIERVLFMIAYANDPYRWQEQTSELGSVSGLIDGMAALFVRACTPLMAQGLLRDYRVAEQDAPLVKGRVRWDRQLRRVAPLPLALRFSVHDDDTIENRVIREATAVLRCLVDSPEPSMQLARLWRHVAHLSPLPDARSGLERVRWSRRNAHYQPILDLAKIILDGHTADVRPGTAAVEAFTVEMHAVFESFVRRVLFGDNFEHWTRQKRTPTGQFALDDAGRVPLVPDLGLHTGQSWRFIGDVKYKDDSNNHNADIYQALAYAVAAGLPEVTLIYAAGSEATTTHVVRSLGTRVHVHRLDLGRSPHDVLLHLRAVRDASSLSWTPHR